MSEVAHHIGTSSGTRAMDVIGDRCAVLIMRDVFQGARRFEDFIGRTGATRATLANRLRVLVAQGLLERVTALAKKRQISRSKLMADAIREAMAQEK